jgi:hypothetical protein
MDESLTDPCARYRPEGYTQGHMPQVQQPRFIPDEPATACLPQQSCHPQDGQPQQEWGPPPPAVSPPHVQTQPAKPPKKRRVSLEVLAGLLGSLAGHGKSAAMPGSGGASGGRRQSRPRPRYGSRRPAGDVDARPQVISR